MSEKGRFSTFQIFLLALFSALIVAAKLVLRFPIKMPGHSGVFWMAILVVGMGIVPRVGAGSIMGLISGLMAGFLGLGDHGLVYTFFSYLMLGIGGDLVGWFLGSTDRLVTCALIGGAAGAAKTVTKAILVRLMGVPAGFLAFGLPLSFLSNVLWGAVGGALGWLILRALRRAGFFAYLAEKR